MIPRRPAPETMIAPAPVVGMKTGTLFAVKRATRPHVALARLALALVPDNMLPHHLRDRQAVTDLIQKGIGKAHEG